VCQALLLTRSGPFAADTTRVHVYIGSHRLPRVHQSGSTLGLTTTASQPFSSMLSVWHVPIRLGNAASSSRRCGAGSVHSGRVHSGCHSVCLATVAACRVLVLTNHIGGACVCVVVAPAALCSMATTSMPSRCLTRSGEQHSR
jgi:hypothetical protein